MARVSNPSPCPNPNPNPYPAEEVHTEGETKAEEKEKPWKGLKRLPAARWEVAVNRMHVPMDMLNSPSPASSAPAQSLLPKGGKGGKKGAGKGKKGTP